MAAAPRPKSSSALLVGNSGYTVGPDSLAGALMREAGLTPPPGAPAGYGGYVPLEKLIMLRPDFLVMTSLVETPDGQGALYLTHPALRALYPPEKRIVLPSRFTLCAGQSLVAAFDYLTDVLTQAGGAELATRACAAHSATMAASASSPSVSAAGPGCRISGDLISRSQPSRTAGMASKPGAGATFAGTNFLPHQEPTMMSGAAAITSRGETMRSLAFLCADSAGNTSMPPAISISSDTQLMPEIIGSSHSSK